MLIRTLHNTDFFSVPQQSYGCLVAWKGRYSPGVYQVRMYDDLNRPLDMGIFSVTEMTSEWQTYREPLTFQKPHLFADERNRASYVPLEPGVLYAVYVMRGEEVVSNSTLSLRLCVVEGDVDKVKKPDLTVATGETSNLTFCMSTDPMTNDVHWNRKDDLGEECIKSFGPPPVKSGSLMFTKVVVLSGLMALLLASLK